MQCSCSAYGGYDDGDGGAWGMRYRRAAKDHKCEECGDIIQKGQEYGFHSLFSEGRIWNYKLCLKCDSLTKHFFDNGWIFGQVIESLEEYLYENWDNDLPSSCISKLPPSARDYVCDYLQRFQQQEG